MEIIKWAGSAQACDEDAFGPTRFTELNKLAINLTKCTAVSNPKIIPKNIITLFVAGIHSVFVSSQFAAFIRVYEFVPRTMGVAVSPIQ